MLREANSLLIVCNKKGEAETLFHAMSGQPLRCFHLSAAMCIDKEFKGYQDCCVKHGQRSLTLLSLLSVNSAYYDSDCPFLYQFQLNQAFKLAGSLFSVFDEDTADVLVPFGDGAALIEELGSIDPVHQPGRLTAALERAKAYGVSLYGFQRRKLEDSGALFPLCGGAVLALQAGWYDEDTGLMTGKGEQIYLEV